VTFPSTRVKDALARATEYILKSYGNGSWGYHPSKEPSTEATAWCSIALRERHAQITQAVTDYLTKTQNQDGGWSTAPRAGPSDWCSGPAILALRLLTKGSRAKMLPAQIDHVLERGFNYLFDSRTDQNRPVARLLLLLIKGPAGLNYGRGWPWNPHCWNWVEPSSYNLLALKIPKVPRPEAFELAINHAHRFFIDHACAGGGWNHGANRTLGINLPPYTVTTAEALLALQDLSDHAVIKSGLAFLDSSASHHRSAMSCAWSILARNAYGLQTPEETATLLSGQKPNGSFGPNLMVTGVAAVALSALAGEHPLLISR
jgi:hypothetical protein